jgi:hypothetical protein
MVWNMKRSAGEETEKLFFSNHHLSMCHLRKKKILHDEKWLTVDLLIRLTFWLSTRLENRESPVWYYDLKSSYSFSTSSLINCVPVQGTSLWFDEESQQEKRNQKKYFILFYSNICYMLVLVLDIMSILFCFFQHVFRASLTRIFLHRNLI